MNNKYREGLDQNILRELRKKLELRQVDMADIMGFVVIDRICHWERGRAVPGLINAIKLCVLFGTDLKGIYPQLYTQIEEEIYGSKNKNYMNRFLKVE